MYDYYTCTSNEGINLPSISTVETCLAPACNRDLVSEPGPAPTSQTWQSNTSATRAILSISKGNVLFQQKKSFLHDKFIMTVKYICNSCNLIYKQRECSLSTKKIISTWQVHHFMYMYMYTWHDNIIPLL